MFSVPPWASVLPRATHKGMKPEPRLEQECISELCFWGFICPCLSYHYSALGVRTVLGWLSASASKASGDGTSLHHWILMPIFSCISSFPCLLVRPYVPCSMWLPTGSIIRKLMGTVWWGLNENDSLHASISVSDSQRAWFHLWNLMNWTACLFPISLYFLNLYSYKIRHNLLCIALIQL